MILTSIVTIREAADLDTPCWSVLGSLAAAHARYEHSATIIPADWAGRVEELLHTGQIALFAALVAGKPIGYASLTWGVSTWTASPYGHLDCLYVDDAHRNEGIGRRLLDAVIAHTQDLGLGDLQWQTPPWNVAAIRFYRRLGADQQTKERFTLTLDDVFRKKLRAISPGTRQVAKKP